MFNLDKSFQTTEAYQNQSISLSILKLFFYFFPVLKFLDILRLQLAEINFIQLVPGFYFLLVLIFFFFFVFFSYLLEKVNLFQDASKILGIKTKKKLFFVSFYKQVNFFNVLAFFFLILLFFPLSLDSINSYGEKNLENLWSLKEVLSLEFFLLLGLFFISQVPLVALVCVGLEKEKNLFPTIWKNFLFSSFLFSGILTPTVDISTQTIFAASTIFLYFLFLYLLIQRIQIKSKSYLSLF